MALRYPGTPNIPSYGNALDGLVSGFEVGQKDRKAFDAQQVLAGNTGAQPPSFLDRLAGVFQPKAQAQASNAVGAIDAAAPNVLPAGIPENAWETIATIPTTGASVPQGYLEAARAAESGGNDLAKNPNSSALGRYQFLDSTWTGLMNQYPELGLTADGRTDPAQQERAMAQFTQDNASALSGAGIPVNPGNLYAAHFLGAGGASNVLKQDPASPMSAFVDPGVIQANPHLANMSVGDFTAWANSKGGNGSGGYSAPMPYDQPSAGRARQFTPEEMSILLASEETRPFAMQLLANEQQAGRYEVQEMPDGSIRQVDRMTGETQILQGAKGPAERQIIEGPDGNSYYVDDGSRVLPGVNAPSAVPPPEVTTRFNPETGLEEKVQWNPTTGAWEPFGGQKAPSNGLTVTTNPDGTTTVQQGGSAKPLTEGQAKDTVYATRANGALPTIDALEQSLLSFGENLAGNVPYGNYLQSEDYQVARDAGREFLASILRKDTGAAVTPSEEQMYGDMFLPRPGDKPMTVQMKRERRARAIAAIEAGMPAQGILNMASALAETATTPASPADVSVPTIADDAGYDALPSGTHFIGPDGVERVKP